MDAVREERTHQVHAEEGQPAHDEAADDDAQSLRRFSLHAKPSSLHMTFFHALTTDRAPEKGTGSVR